MKTVDLLLQPNPKRFSKVYWVNFIIETLKILDHTALLGGNKVYGFTLRTTSVGKKLQGITSVNMKTHPNV